MRRGPAFSSTRLLTSGRRASFPRRGGARVGETRVRIREMRVRIREMRGRVREMGTRIDESQCAEDDFWAVPIFRPQCLHVFVTSMSAEPTSQSRMA